MNIFIHQPLGFRKGAQTPSPERRNEVTASRFKAMKPIALVFSVGPIKLLLTTGGM